MTERAKGRAQDLAIVLLSISAVLLLLQTPLFGEELPWSGEETPAGTESTRAASAVAPVRMLFSNEFTRLGSDALTTADDAFESAGTLLGEALGSAYGETSVSEAAFLSALEGEGIYFDLTAPLPPELLGFWLGVEVPQMQLARVRRGLLTAGGTRVTLYLQADGMGCSRFYTALDAAALEEYLLAADGEEAELAATLGGVYEAVSPYTMVFSEEAARPVLSAQNAAQMLTTEGLLRAAEFNAHTASRYDESGTGALVVVDGLRTLRIAPDGTVSYQGGSSESGSIYRVNAAAETPDVTEAVSAARTLLSAVRSGAAGDEALFAAGVEQTQAGFVIEFDYMVGGTAVRFSDGAHAASVTVEGTEITAFTLRMRRYEATEESTALLPMRFSAVISAERYRARVLSAAYVDSGSERVSAVYLAE